MVEYTNILFASMLFRVITLLIVFVAIVFVYNIWVRTKDFMHKGVTYIFLSVIFFGITQIIEFFEQGLFLGMIDELLNILFIFLLTKGFWDIMVCIKRVSDGRLIKTERYKPKG